MVSPDHNELHWTSFFPWLSDWCVFSEILHCARAFCSLCKYFRRNRRLQWVLWAKEIVFSINSGSNVWLDMVEWVGVTVRPAEGPKSFQKKREVGSFILRHKISRTACCFGIRTFLKQYNCHESATIWYSDHQYLTQYSEIINNLQETPLLFCNYAVHSSGTWRKGPGESPRNVVDFRFKAISNINEYGCLWPRHRLKCGTYA